MFGYLTCIDMEDCSNYLITSTEAITEYLDGLIKLIDMKAFGVPHIVKFGNCPSVAGFTFVQMIETSLISGHFVDANNTGFIDIFSCKPYDSLKATSFTGHFFKAANFKYRLVERGFNHS